MTDEDVGTKNPSDVVACLVEILGARLVAVIADVEHTRTVREWLEDRAPEGKKLHVLRFALRVAAAIESRFGAHVAQSWFQGLNHHLSDRAPALLLKCANEAQIDVITDVEKSVLNALWNFLAN